MRNPAQRIVKDLLADSKKTAIMLSLTVVLVIICWVRFGKGRGESPLVPVSVDAAPDSAVSDLFVLERDREKPPFPEFLNTALSFEEIGFPAILSFIGFLLTPVVCWILIVVLPLTRNGQTVGLKLFGLKVVGLVEGRASTGQIVLRESFQLVAVGLFVGIAGLVWSFFDVEGRTLFDKTTGTRVVQVPAKLKWVNEFREYRSKNSSPISDE